MQHGTSDMKMLPHKELLRMQTKQSRGSAYAQDQKQKTGKETKKDVCSAGSHDGVVLETCVA